MGYWSEHPLGGDQPLDAQLFLYKELGIKDLYDKCFLEESTDREKLQAFLQSLKSNLKNNLDKVLKHPYIKKYPFVIPYTVAENNLILKDNELILKLKNLIGDGGAYNRGYAVEESNRGNGYNNFNSPSDYASELRDNWEHIVSGSIVYSDLAKGKCLFEVLSTQINETNDNNTRIINIK